MQGRSVVPLLAGVVRSGRQRPGRGQGRRLETSRPAITEKAARARRQAAPGRQRGGGDRGRAASSSFHNTHLLPLPTPELELFDFRKDPLDAHDLADKHPEVVQRLARALEAWRRTAQAARLKPDSATAGTMSAEELERLRALGYVQ